MINLIMFLIFGEWKCHHKWRTYDRAENKVNGYYVCTTIFQQCEKCGKEKAYQIDK